MDGYHRSALLREAIDAFIPTRLRQDGLATAGKDACHVPERYMAWYLDCTLGDGGHSIEIIARGGKVVGIDVDPQALQRVRQRFKSLGIEEDRYKLVKGNFRDLNNLFLQMGLKQKFAGAIFDLGVSSLQLETPERGFSFSKPGPLDMRMDPALAVQALDLVNSLSRKELYELFRNLGEEKYSKRLADALVCAREIKPILNTLELAKIVERNAGGKRGNSGFARALRDKHPATKVFQALRIAVNDELGALKEGLEEVKEAVEKNGRIVVISFHSLEDRIVKNTFKEWQFAGFGRVLTKKPVVPGEVELTANPRSRSAKMRVFERF